MKNQLHIVLGGAGAIGNAVIKELLARDLKVKAVEYAGAVDEVETIKADVFNQERLQESIQGATYVYLCIGLPYRSDVWLKGWPKAMRNLIEACSHEKAKLDLQPFFGQN